MDKTSLARDDRWFRNPIVWLIITIPSMTVLGCLLTIYIALSNPDFLVKGVQDEIHSTEARQP